MSPIRDLFPHTFLMEMKGWHFNLLLLKSKPEDTISEDSDFFCLKKTILFLKCLFGFSLSLSSFLKFISNWSSPCYFFIYYANQRTTHPEGSYAEKRTHKNRKAKKVKRKIREIKENRKRERRYKQRVRKIYLQSRNLHI